MPGSRGVDTLMLTPVVRCTAMGHGHGSLDAEHRVIFLISSFNYVVGPLGLILIFRTGPRFGRDAPGLIVQLFQPLSLIIKYIDQSDQETRKIN